MQEVIDYVLNLTSEKELPDKVVIVHQLEAIQPTKNVEVLLNNDGHGIAALKGLGYH
ncbi:hypothetical protein [Terribacillus saccharophilus]|uniref:hypothetical protein n=1 Tax=Terribacillus saccharophilus TaxID=361277 RepID=UPI003981AFB7